MKREFEGEVEKEGNRREARLGLAVLLKPGRGLLPFAEFLHHLGEIGVLVLDYGDVPGKVRVRQMFGERGEASACGSPRYGFLRRRVLDEPLELFVLVGEPFRDLLTQAGEDPPDFRLDLGASVRQGRLHLPCRAAFIHG